MHTVQPHSTASGAPPPTPTAPPPSLGQLIDDHQSMVWRYLRLLGADGHEADDLMQDTFVCTAATLQRGEALAAPAAYLRGIARNLLLAARRRARRSPPTQPWVDAVDRHLAARPAALTDDRLEVLRRCLAQLSGRAREAIDLHHFEGASLGQTAGRLGLQLEGVRALLRRARNALRDCAERHSQEDRT